MKKCGMVMLTILLASCATVAVKQDAPGWEARQVGNSIRYAVPGTAVASHRLGFIKNTGKCDQDRPLLTWSSARESISANYDRMAEFTYSVNGTTLPFKAVKIGRPFESTANRALIWLRPAVDVAEFVASWGDAQEIEISVTGPGSLTDDLDVLTDVFSVKGFKQARDKALEMCGGNKNQATAPVG